MKTAVAKGTNALVSLKTSRQLLKEIKGKKVDKAKEFLEGLINQKRDLDGQYHTKTARKLLDIVKSAEANAKSKTMNVERLFIRNARADKAEKRILAKSRAPHRGREGKSANIEIVVEER
ncbi:MAG: uL22 family ribosomal protein [Candidatus Aenigmatarchaeota archaeon]